MTDFQERLEKTLALQNQREKVMALSKLYAEKVRGQADFDESLWNQLGREQRILRMMEMKVDDES